MCSALRNGGEFEITEFEIDDIKWLKSNDDKTKGIRLDFEIAAIGVTPCEKVGDARREFPQMAYFSELCKTFAYMCCSFSPLKEMA